MTAGTVDMTKGGLPLEIERKFLLRHVPMEALQVPAVAIEQGWLPGRVIRERLRKRIDHDGGISYWRTIKVGAVSQRIELEEQIDENLFDSLWPLTRQARIHKHRHAVPFGHHVWEIDIFSDRPLVLAEIELRSLDEAIDIPDWLAPCIVREVTDDPAYLNSQLALPDT